jgi:hypothetical protein
MPAMSIYSIVEVNDLPCFIKILCRNGNKKATSKLMALKIFEKPN